MERDMDDGEALMQPLFVSIKSEPVFEKISDDTNGEENFEATENTDEHNMESGECAMRGDKDDAEALVQPLFMPIKTEPDFERTSEKIIMENLRATEHAENCSANLTGLSEGRSSEFNVLKEESAASVDGCTLQNDPELSKRMAGRLKQYLYHSEKSPLGSCIKSVTPSTSDSEEVSGRDQGEYGGQLQMYREECDGAGESWSRAHNKEKTCEREDLNLSLRKVSSVLSQREKKTEKALYCDTCGRCFSTKNILERHKVQIHTRENPFRCVLCNKTCTTKGHLIVHMKVHSEKELHKCTICENSFKKNGDLEKHMRLHSGEKPFMCEECGKTFAQSGTLVTHLRSHTGEKPYKCTECGNAFSDHSTFTKHMRSHTGEKPYKCTQCGKAFSRSFVLNQHMRIHGNEKPHVCTHCGIAFTQSSNLTAHMRCHTGEKPYKCTECGEAFSHSSSVTKHMRVHTGERPFACEDCGSRFTTSNNLQRHRRLVHAVPSPVS